MGVIIIEITGGPKGVARWREGGRDTEVWEVWEGGRERWCMPTLSTGYLPAPHTHTRAPPRTCAHTHTHTYTHTRARAHTSIVSGLDVVEGEVTGVA